MAEPTVGTLTSEGFVDGQWLLNEDGALKRRLQGLRVHDNRTAPGGREVEVRFHQPEGELAAYEPPLITVQLVDISEETSDAHRGRIRMPYVPSGVVPPGEGQRMITDFPIPVALDYQINTWARFALHDRQIVSGLLNDPRRTPLRFGYLEIPEDNTIRRLEFRGMITADTLDENNKRLFRKIISVRVSSELLAEEIRKVTQVLNVNATIRYGSGYRFEEPVGT